MYINFGLSYVKPDTHIKFIPNGWRTECYLPLYFSQIYKLKCLHVILLDSAVWTPQNMKMKL